MRYLNTYNNVKEYNDDNGRGLYNTVSYIRNENKVIYDKYPNYAGKENLVLHYDFLGIKNSDATRGIARDLSGNGNNGVLRNFAYTNGSGYLDNALIFDGIDDFITIPKPLIDLNNFTYSEGINVLSFRGDEVASVVDGVIEIGGRNLFREGNEKSIISELDDRVVLVTRGYYNSSGGIAAGNPLIISHNLENGETYTLSGRLDVPNHPTVPGHNNIKILYEDGLVTIGKFPSNYEYHSFTFNIDENRKFVNLHFDSGNYNAYIESKTLKLEKGNNATPWAPAPEDLDTTTFKPLFDNKIKSALYWNRALTDEELLQVYNTQVKRT